MASELFELAAAITGAQARALGAKARRGTHSARIYVKHVPVDVTYNVTGRYIPATQIEPAEYPDYEIVTAEVGGEDVMPWAARLDFEAVLLDRAMDGDL